MPKITRVFEPRPLDTENFDSKDKYSTPGMVTVTDIFAISSENMDSTYFSESLNVNMAQFYTLSFTSNMIKEADLNFGSLRLLEVDQRLILPIRAMIRLGVTSVDVIHCWAVQALGKKLDALPGRLNVTSIYISMPGVYYGQCSEICGIDHAFMPIVVEGVETEFFFR
jgi:heme/copper-type cytochrome/quinol oxidase subunit 2